MIGRVTGEDIGKAGFDSDAAEGQQIRLLPLVGALELVVTQLDADGSSWAVGCGRDKLIAVSR